LISVLDASGCPCRAREFTWPLGSIYRLRYEVYCLEAHYLDSARYPHGLELDGFDDHSVHFAAVDHRHDVTATLRLVQPSPEGLPLDRHADVLDPLYRRLPPGSAGEVSRLIIARGHRGEAAQEPLLLFGLLRELYEESRRRGLTYLLATMESALWRLLRRLGFPFEPIGPCIEHMGAVFPYKASLDRLHPGYRGILAYHRRRGLTSPPGTRFLRLTS
jgi:N-acyl-L-homoserine lactone synthetase